MKRQATASIVAMCILAGSSPVRTQEKYAGPWDRAAEAAAEAAVARLGAQPALDIQATVIAVPALASR